MPESDFTLAEYNALLDRVAELETQLATAIDADKVPLIWKIREAYKTAHNYHSMHGEHSSIDGCKHEVCAAIARAWSEAAKVLQSKGVDSEVVNENAITIPALKAKVSTLESRLAAAEELAHQGAMLRAYLTKNIRYLNGEPLTKVTLSPDSWEIAQTMEKFDKALSTFREAK